MFRQHDGDPKYSPLAVAANEVLIVLFSDRDAAIWRFEQIKERAAPHVEEMGMHEVGPLEHELHDKEFGRPLTRLNERYIQEFIKLLDVSLDLLRKDQGRVSKLFIVHLVPGL
ncbi:hypothetical protein IPG36_00150 [bacterium]|nr:MAG: hypothetical protein IPG36_00150 [bacterium]